MTQLHLRITRSQCYELFQQFLESDTRIAGDVRLQIAESIGEFAYGGFEHCAVAPENNPDAPALIVLCRRDCTGMEPYQLRTVELINKSLELDKQLGTGRPLAIFHIAPCPDSTSAQPTTERAA